MRRYSEFFDFHSDVDTEVEQEELTVCDAKEQLESNHSSVFCER
jgi:hypothetical protein